MRPMERDLTVEPVAVIGVGCRFPGGADSPEAFWRLLCSDGGVGESIRPRPGRPGRDRGTDQGVIGHPGAARRDGPADGEAVDAELLEPSPGAAEPMDPQQRILLQMAREALHHAAISPRELAGTDTGVFIGVCTGGDGDRRLDDLPSHEGWTGAGEASTAAARGLSRVLDLRGASMAVDTACSTSLVALHLAVKSLRIGQSPLALAGGVDLIRAPGRTPTPATVGRPGAPAGWGEGGAVVVLKRLSDAERDGDRVLALIGGSAVGRQTAGGPAARGGTQEDVLSRACRLAGIAPSTVDYVEAHGTGSRLGGPLGAATLGGVFGPRSAERPCLIGSVTSTIGHLEGAAGIAGVITTVLALQHAEIPASLLDPNPAVDWTGLRVVTERTPWPAGEHPRRAGVSSFGYGGTVAHLVLQQAPPRGPRQRPRKAPPEASAGGLGCRVPAHGVSAQQGKVVHETPRSDRDRPRPLLGPARSGPRAPLPLRRAHDSRKPGHPVPMPPA